MNYFLHDQIYGTFMNERKILFSVCMQTGFVSLDGTYEELQKTNSLFTTFNSRPKMFLHI